jgi:hypothetical protein
MLWTKPRHWVSLEMCQPTSTAPCIMLCSDSSWWGQPARTELLNLFPSGLVRFRVAYPSEYGISKAGIFSIPVCTVTLHVFVLSWSYRWLCSSSLCVYMLDCFTVHVAMLFALLMFTGCVFDHFYICRNTGLWIVCAFTCLYRLGTFDAQSLDV